MGYKVNYPNLGYFATTLKIEMTNKSWNENREAFRALLKALRKNEAQLTQVELSNALGRPQSYVSKYENGERRLDYVEVSDTCKVLGITMQRFNRLYEKKSKQS